MQKIPYAFSGPLSTIDCLIACMLPEYSLAYAVAVDVVTSGHVTKMQALIKENLCRQVFPPFAFPSPVLSFPLPFPLHPRPTAQRGLVN